MLKNYLINTPIEVSVPKIISLQPEAFKNVWTYNENSIVSMPSDRIVFQLADMWQEVIGNKGWVSIEPILLDKTRIKKVDIKNRIIQPLDDDNELLNMDESEMACSRAITRLVVHGLDNEVAPAIGISINEKGLSLGWGDNVWVCSNFNMFSDKIFSTYGKSQGGKQVKKLNREVLIDIFKNFMDHTEEHFEQDLAMIERCKQVQIHRYDWFAFLGEMTTQIETANEYRNQKRLDELSDEEKSLAVNSRQLADICVEARQPRHEVYAWQNDSTTLWNVINYGTEVIKVEQGTDSLKFFEQTKNWTELVLQKFPIHTSHNNKNENINKPILLLN